MCVYGFYEGGNGTPVIDDRFGDLNGAAIYSGDPNNTAAIANILNEFENGYIP